MSGKKGTRSKRFPNPYVGPKPFTGEESDRFFGRTEEIAILEGLVLARRVTLLFAQSGAGKSSLLNAGLIPSLQKIHTGGYGVRKYRYQKMRVLPVLSVGGAIPADVREQDVKNVYVFSTLLTLYPQERQRRKLIKLSLAEGLENSLGRAQDQEDAPADEGDEIPDTLIIFDQFEELFTRHPEHWREREKFFTQVRDALDDYPSLRMLFSMREDYIAELTPYLGLLPDRMSSQFRLERLREAAALDAIRLPAEKAGRHFAEDAAELLVEWLRASQPTGPDTRSVPTSESPAQTAAQTEFVEPVQLQVVCQRLWDKLPADKQTIERHDVEKYGDVQMALQEFYEQAIRDVREETLTPGKSVGELRLRTWFERQLITPAGTRSLVYKGENDTGGLPNAIVEFLDYAAHIIRPMIRGRDTWYELTHDRLVAVIRRSNWVWRRVHAASWQLQAERWEQENQPESLLLSEDALAEALQWSDQQEYTPEPHEQRFLGYSRQRLDSIQRRRTLESGKRIHLEETGWGVIFAQDDPQAAAIRMALQELLEWRKEEAGTRYQLFGFEGREGYNSGESAQQFLRRFGVGPGITNYEKVPYYLLLVGDPERIPLEFQYGLQTRYAVGRLFFQDLPAYANYARSVVQSENGSSSLLPQVALFGPQNPGDFAAGYAMPDLIKPLLGTLHSLQQDRDWEIGLALQAEATEERLKDLLGGPGTPALLFSVSHGLSMPNGDPMQRALQGAILYQVDPPSYFAGGDLDDEARLWGSIAFLFGGWSAGTPRMDNFPPAEGVPEEIAPAPFVADLPQRLLGHARGGMLAVVGHVDRMQTASFSWKGVELGTTHFSSVLRRLMEGYTMGAAIEPLTQRYALLASMLAEELQQVFFYGGKGAQSELAGLNLHTVDARNFVILGDPAVRLPLENGPVARERPTIEPPQLSDEILAQASVAAQAVEYEDIRAKTSAALASDLSEEAKTQMLDQRIEEAQAIEAASERVQALVSLASLLDGDALRSILKQALEAAAAIDYERLRAQALVALAPYLSDDLLEKGLALAKAIADEGIRAQALAALAPDLSSPRLYFNGVSGATGEYWTPPLTVRELAEIIRGDKPPEDLAELEPRWRYGASVQL